MFAADQVAPSAKSACPSGSFREYVVFWWENPHHCRKRYKNVWPLIYCRLRRKKGRHNVSNVIVRKFSCATLHNMLAYLFNGEKNIQKSGMIFQKCRTEMCSVMDCYENIY